MARRVSDQILEKLPVLVSVGVESDRGLVAGFLEQLDPLVEKFSEEEFDRICLEACFGVDVVGMTFFKTIIAQIQLALKAIEVGLYIFH